LGLHAARPAIGDLKCVNLVQATSSKLQRSELSVNAAQLELDNLKAHVREQDDVIVGLHEQLQANQALLGTISRAANQHVKPIGDPSTTLFCLSCQLGCSEKYSDLIKS